MARRDRLRSWTSCAGAALGIAAVAGLQAMSAPALAAGAPPTVTMRPSPPPGGYRDQQTVSISVPANRLFKPGQVVVVLECADPGGRLANLPIDNFPCDGATQYPDSVIFGRDGSVAISNYQLYELPSPALAELPNAKPACGTAAVPCVLYVGEDQNDFTQPKAFSAPFTFTGDPKISPATGAATGNGAATPPARDPSSSAATPATAPSLAFTGPSPLTRFAAIAGGALLLAACTARRRLRATGVVETGAPAAPPSPR